MNISVTFNIIIEVNELNYQNIKKGKKNYTVSVYFFNS